MAFAAAMIGVVATLLSTRISSSSEALGKQQELTNASNEQQLNHLRDQIKSSSEALSKQQELTNASNEQQLNHLRDQIKSSSEALSKQLELINASVQQQLQQQTRGLEDLNKQTAQRTDKLQDRVAGLGAIVDELASRVRDLEQ